MDQALNLTAWLTHNTVVGCTAHWAAEGAGFCALEISLYIRPCFGNRTFDNPLALNMFTPVLLWHARPPGLVHANQWTRDHNLDILNITLHFPTQYSVSPNKWPYYLTQCTLYIVHWTVNGRLSVHRSTRHVVLARFWWKWQSSGDRKLHVWFQKNWTLNTVEFLIKLQIWSFSEDSVRFFWNQTCNLKFFLVQCNYNQVIKLDLVIFS
jgi:hypothetical protein